MKYNFKMLLFSISFLLISLCVAKKALNKSDSNDGTISSVELKSKSVKPSKRCSCCGSYLSQRSPMMKRVYRSRHDKIIAGVCGGLGNYFGVDPVLIRLGCVLSTFLGGAGLVAYIVAWIIIPKEPLGQINS